MLTADEFLTPADVAALTGHKQSAKQCERLELLGVPYLLGTTKRPLVSRHHTRLIATGQEVRQSAGPNWSAVK